MYFELFISFCAIFLVFFAVDMFLVIRPAIMEMTGKKKEKKPKKTKKAKKTKKEKQLVEIDYLCSKFKLNKSNLDYEELIYMIPLNNAFIIALVAIIVDLIPLPIIFKMVIGFVLLLGLIYAVYEIYGRHLKKKEQKD